jgi:hypothetical protein
MPLESLYQQHSQTVEQVPDPEPVLLGWPVSHNGQQCQQVVAHFQGFLDALHYGHVWLVLQGFQQQHYQSLGFQH